MIVCQCNGTTDRDIRRAIRSGADSVDRVGSVCGAGTTCGGCRPVIRLLLREELLPVDVSVCEDDPRRPGPDSGGPPAVPLPACLRSLGMAGSAAEDEGTATDDEAFEPTQ